MWQTPYDGSDSEVAVVTAVLQGNNVDQVCRDTNYTAEDVVAIVTDYLEQRQRILGQLPARRNHQTFQLAILDTILENMAPQSVQAAREGDVKTVQAFFGLIERRAHIEAEFLKLNELAGFRPVIADTPKGDSQRDDAKARHLRLEDYARRGLLNDDELDFGEATEAIIGQGG